MKILIRLLLLVKVLVISLVVLLTPKKVSATTIIIERQIKSRYVKEAPTPTVTPKPASTGKIQAPRPTFKPVPVTGTIADKIRQVFGADAETAIRVAFCESGLQPYNWNDKWLGVTLEQAIATKRAFGIFQIYLKAHPQHNPYDLLDADYNIREAYKLFQASGWGPWEASHHCWQTTNI